MVFSKHSVFERTVCGILNKIKIECSDAEIQACHRIKNKRTIVKFTNRKKIYEIFKAKNDLRKLKMDDINGLTKDSRIYINESLCPYYRLLWSKCKDLLNRNKIYRFWTSIGTVRVKVNEHSDPITIQHEDDLQELNGE